MSDAAPPASRLAQVFGRVPVVLPVVHPVGRAEALESLRVVAAAGVRGVFLVDQGMDEAGVLALAREARERRPELWIGVNLLSRRPADALVVALRALDGELDGLWSDDAGVDERAHPRPHAEELLAVRRSLDWRGLYFGGVAFKYQREVPPESLPSVAARAAHFVDVVCTSGPGTGQPARVDKVRAMRAGLPGAALALASGVTAENARDYAPYVDAVLVGTGIEARLGVVDEGRLTALLRTLEPSTAHSAVG